ncbi:hypothetical protein CMUS01_05767 [Colletotrichum musicola]|uniref:Uncharacterized protein n=1 Tax=Colletotrichum musicola TaxID=2175873 RepID=A0A8H6KPW7_9PEZI|nr:hypothetical protein CMUS01_05767 [Colletotrichum musicola]
MKSLLPLTLPSNTTPPPPPPTTTTNYSRPSILSIPPPFHIRPDHHPSHWQQEHHQHHQQQQQQHPDEYQPGDLCIHPGTMAEAAEPTLDCNLPELLAQDLEFSALVFAAKNMTAGAPSPALASDEEEWPSAEPPQVLGAPCHPNGVPQFQPLGAIDEKSSRSGASEHDISDAASSSSSGMSFSEAGGDDDDDDEAAASPQIRQQSVITTDTTISASSQPPTANTHKRLVSFCDGSDDSSITPGSWMDLEPEAPGDHPELGKSLDQSPVSTPIKPVRPLSRLGDKSINESPPRAKSANAAAATASGRRLSNPFDGYTRPASRARSLQVDPTTAAAKEKNRHSFHSMHSVEIPVPTRCSSLKHRVSFTDDARKVITPRSRARSHTSSSRAPSEHVVAPGTNRSSIIADLKEELEPWFRYLDEQEGGLAPPLLVTPRRPTSRSAAEPSRSVVTPRPRSQAHNRSRPTSSVSASYTWLEDPIDAPSPSSDEARRIPLPPNVVESLRISVTCFPETMLLCSSLSIETIRNYSRKVRHPALQEPVARPETPPASPKQRWRWLAPRRTANSVRCRSRSSSSNVDLPSMPPSTATLLAPPQWSRIRNLFPNGSDYLCDALYAHVVAYNYILPMVQSAPRPPTPGTPGTLETNSGSTDDSIPKKAATLLGLQGLQDGTLPLPPPLRKRSSMFMSRRACSSRQSVLPPPTPAPPATPVQQTSSSDVPLRDLVMGLRRCVARLVATLRAEGSDGPLAGESVNEIDPLIMRSLCEIVKCCEESPTNERLG